MTRPALLFYGDDFTGATDALATAAEGGLRSLLFLRVPDDELLTRVGALDCIGIAGAARAMAPVEMRVALAPVAALARRLQPHVLHYKICSTFDSAPGVGNIATAVAALRGAVARPGVIVLGGQPSLRRYCLFGHLFASGADGEVVRIDRHPTMSRHPVTPMHEADLRRHLAAQGLAPLALLPWTQLEADGDADLLPEGDVLVDAARPEHVARIGRAIAQGPVGEGVLVVGPSSVVEAVVAARPGPGRPATQPARKRAAGPVFVLAGSQSPNTARQVAAATSYQLVHIDAARLADAAPAGYLAELVDTCMAHLSAGRPVLACTMPPPGAAPPATVADPRALAEAGGRLLAAVLARAPLARVGVAGGDTSSHAVLGLDAWGLSFMRRLAPGVSLCRLHSDQPELDGLELMLKGGQMGGDDLFERLLAD